MNKWVEIIGGLLLLNIAIFLWLTNIWELGQAALTLLKGGLMWIIILLGCIFILLGINDLKE